MNLVAIDVGTTMIKCGCFEGETLKETWQYQTKDSATIGGDLLSRTADSKLAMASVAPAAANDIEKAIKRPIFKINPHTQKFIQGFQPEYGADRVADTVAARLLYAPNKNLAVIALGTCTVLTTILANGAVDGGFITLGFHRMVSELTIAAQLVDTVQAANYENFDLEFGFNTNDQIMNGTALAQIGIVECWLKFARKKLGEPLVTVATGGNAQALLNASIGTEKLADYIDPHLTLKGIRLIATSES